MVHVYFVHVQVYEGLYKFTKVPIQVTKHSQKNLRAYIYIVCP